MKEHVHCTTINVINDFKIMEILSCNLEFRVINIKNMANIAMVSYILNYYSQLSLLWKWQKRCLKMQQSFNETDDLW